MHLHLTWKELNPLSMNRMAQPLHLTYSLEWLSISALISNMEGTESSHHDRMDQPLHLTSSSEWLWDTVLISVMEGTNLLTMTEYLIPYI